MPGKVNPVIPEVMNQIAYKVMGNELCVTMAGEAAQMELNAMEPVMAQCCFESVSIPCVPVAWTVLSLTRIVAVRRYIIASAW